MRTARHSAKSNSAESFDCVELAGVSGDSSGEKHILASYPTILLARSLGSVAEFLTRVLRKRESLNPQFRCNLKSRKLQFDPSYQVSYSE